MSWRRDSGAQDLLGVGFRVAGLCCSGSARAGPGEVVCAVPAVVAATAGTHHHSTP
jgi:hypothetical protein